MSVNPLSEANNLRSQVIYVNLVIKASILSRGFVEQTLKQLSLRGFKSFYLFIKLSGPLRKFLCKSFFGLDYKFL